MACGHLTTKRSNSTQNFAPYPNPPDSTIISGYVQKEYDFQPSENTEAISEFNQIQSLDERQADENEIKDDEITKNDIEGDFLDSETNLTTASSPLEMASLDDIDQSPNRSIKKSPSNGKLKQRKRKSRGRS